MKVVDIEDLKINRHCACPPHDCWGDCEECSDYVISWKDILEFIHIYDADIKGE